MQAAKIWPFELVDLYRTGLETTAGIVLFESIYVFQQLQWRQR